MRVLVTGGTGTVGREAVKRLVAHGHAVRVIGRRSELAVPGAEYRPCDINDYAALRVAMRGLEGVVHLAAIPNPALGTGDEIIRVNVSGTFNVYHAAAAEGIKRVVQASSINALGYYLGVKSFPLRYFPVDEEHPSYTTDPYSLSKQLVEEIAAYFWRREGISGLSLRLPYVYEMPEGREGEEQRGFFRAAAEGHRAVLALPPAARAAKVREVVTKYEAMRAARFWELPYREQEAAYQDPDAWLIFGHSNFWTSVDARDSAQAIEQGLTADYQGSHVLFVNDSHNFIGLDSHALVETFFPTVTTWKQPVAGSETLVSIARARALLGYKPEFSLLRT